MTHSSRHNTAVNDDIMMTIALNVSVQSRHIARPNPWVGAVAVSKSGKLTTGSTQTPGNEHAEVVALDKLGKEARGSTLWVTLEPCVHHGKTPPCTKKIIDSGVARVVVGVSDPDFRVNGEGINALRKAGIEVTTNLLASRVTQELAPYLISRTLKRPFVTLKLASTLDGYIAAKDGSSKWITNPTSRERVQELRRLADVIVVGANTVRLDNPSLRVTGDDAASPKRIIFGAIPPDSKVIPAREHYGSPIELIQELSKQDVLTIMVEGGAKVAHSFLHSNLVDQIHLFLAPKFLGGNKGTRLFEGTGASSISEAINFELITSTIHDGDIELVLRSKEAVGILNDLSDA